MIAPLPAPNPFGTTERAKRATERAFRSYLMAGDFEAEIGVPLLADAILRDPECAAVRALQALGIDPSSITGPEPEPRPRPEGLTLMVKFSSTAGQALRSASAAAQAAGRPTSTGDLLLGLLEHDPDWRDRAGVDLEAVRNALSGLEAEE
jgi:hypothetical protein